MEQTPPPYVQCPAYSLADQDPHPLDDQDPLPLDDQGPLPLDDQDPHPLDDQDPLPLDDQDPHLLAESPLPGGARRQDPPYWAEGVLDNRTSLIGPYLKGC